MIRTTVHTYSDLITKGNIEIVVHTLTNKVFTSYGWYNFDSSISVKVYIYKKGYTQNQIKRVNK